MKPATQYIIKSGLADTHWGKIIIFADSRNSFSEKDCKEAGCWNTCACGKKFPQLIESTSGEPMDDLLKELGDWFMIAVVQDNINRAAELLVLIELRATSLLAELEEEASTM